MLDEYHDDRGWKLVDEGFNDRPVNSRNSRVLKASGHWAQDGEFRRVLTTDLAVISVDEPADQGIKKNDECGSECRDEEKHLGSLGHLSGCSVASTPDEVEQSQSR